MSTNSFIVSARKYRPATFDTVVGQSVITGTLRNAIKNQHVAQAYLFCGPRGVGKTTCARILAKTLNCFQRTENMEACDHCESCVSFKESRSYNIHELDAASNNSVEDIRNLIDKVRIPPQIGKYSVYIIDEVHMLSSAAFNAFLKTLEEPPAHAIFILATTEKHKIIPTILSRCQIYDFNRIKIDDTVQYLQQISEKEGVSYDTDALSIIAQKADGGMRDALSIYDQMVSYCGNHITYKSVIENLNILDYEYYFKLTDAFLDHQIGIGVSFVTFNEILDKGFDGHNFISGLSSHFRDLLVCKDPITLSLLEVGANIRERYREQAARCGVGFLFEALNICNACDVGYKMSKNQRLHVELALLRLCEIGVEKKKSDGQVTSAAAPATSPPAAGKPPATKPSQRPDLPNVSIREALGAKPVPAKEPADSTPAQQQPQQQESNAAQNEPFTQEAVTAAWNEFAGKYRNDPYLFSLLTAHQPQPADDAKINFSISNSLQKEAFQKIIPELADCLRAQLKNNRIEIHVTTTEKQETHKAYTAEDKFVEMSRKNPALLVFRQQFALDFN
ncbi:MAG: DNA polymerase III subunit gamma/tau [Bacteroidales bacterium]|nr:DNA polymerase III subunit gamma/tau [Bacteroidales bacterium]